MTNYMIGFLSEHFAGRSAHFLPASHSYHYLLVSTRALESRLDCTIEIKSEGVSYAGIRNQDQGLHNSNLNIFTGDVPS